MPTTVPVSLNIANPALYDTEAYRMLQRSSNTTLTTALASTDTTVVLTNTTLAVGQGFLVDSEPMLITAVQLPGTYTVTRSSCLAFYTAGAATAHAAGVQVFLLTYASATALVKYIVGLFMQSTIIPALGANSSVTGALQATLANTQASIAAATVPATLVS